MANIIRVQVNEMFAVDGDVTSWLKISNLRQSNILHD